MLITASWNGAVVLERIAEGGASMWRREYDRDGAIRHAIAAATDELVVLAMGVRRGPLDMQPTLDVSVVDADGDARCDLRLDREAPDGPLAMDVDDDFAVVLAGRVGAEVGIIELSIVAP